MAAALGSIFSNIAGFVTQTIEALIAKGPVAAVKGAVTKRALIAAVWPALRTIGWLGEQLEPQFIALLPPGLQETARRIAAAQRFFSMAPFIGMASFRRGVAYRNASDVAEGWLAFFPEMFAEGTVAQSLTFGMVSAIQAGDWVKALDIVGDALTEAKLEDPLAFLRGLAQIGQDLETIAGKAGAMTMLTALLGDILTKITSGEFVDMQDILDFFSDLQEGEFEELERPEEPEGREPGEFPTPPRLRPPERPIEFGPEELQGELTAAGEDIIGGYPLWEQQDLRKSIMTVAKVLIELAKIPALGRWFISEFRIPEDVVHNSEALLRKIVRLVTG